MLPPKPLNNLHLTPIPHAYVSSPFSSFATTLTFGYASTPHPTPTNTTNVYKEVCSP